MVALAPGGTAGSSPRSGPPSRPSTWLGARLALRTGDGRLVRLAAGEAVADRLGYAYATTVHRSQGATTTRAHLFADGGGRELAYVAMSRAREGTQVWTVADDLGQAREDLARDWSSQRRPTWAIDTGLPDPGQLDRTALATLPVGKRMGAIAVVGAQARLSADAMRAALPPDPSPRLGAATATLARLRRERADLESGTGAYGQTAAGQAVTGLRDALAELNSAHKPRGLPQLEGPSHRQAEPSALSRGGRSRSTPMGRPRCPRAGAPRRRGC